MELNHHEESTTLSESGSNDEFSDCDQRSSSIANELGLMELHKDDKAYELINHHFSQSPQCQNVSILKNTFQSPLGQAKLKVFHIITESVAKKNGGSKTAAEAARVKYCWCGVEKKELRAMKVLCLVSVFWEQKGSVLLGRLGEEEEENGAVIKEKENCFGKD